MDDSKTTKPEWWERHDWISHHSVVGYAKCSKCGKIAMNQDLNDKCGVENSEFVASSPTG